MLTGGVGVRVYQIVTDMDVVTEMEASSARTQGSPRLAGRPMELALGENFCILYWVCFESCRARSCLVWRPT